MQASDKTATVTDAAVLELLKMASDALSDTEKHSENGPKCYCDSLSCSRVVKHGSGAADVSSIIDQKL